MNITQFKRAQFEDPILVPASQLIDYLQSMLTTFEGIKSKVEAGKDTKEHLEEFLDQMIACKEMTERLIGYPVNLQKDGKVTIGF